MSLFKVRVDPAPPAHLFLRHLLPPRVLRPLRRRQECRQSNWKEPRPRGEPEKVPKYVGQTGYDTGNSAAKLRVVSFPWLRKCSTPLCS